MAASDDIGADRDTAARRGWMGVLAKAAPADLAARLAPLPLPEAEVLKGPEVGTAMVRGRAGGTGAAFNLGEMTVTRCVLRLPTGEMGHAMVQGRDTAHARRAALVDALMQGPRAAEIRAAVIAPLEDAARARDAARAAKADATRVEFFTLVRGDNA
jgi:alpha-D-ribose 1-methylphosphonate 5-triphosphate synthase subunit PhnG